MQHHLTSSNSWSWQIRSKSKQYIYILHIHIACMYGYIYIHTYNYICTCVCAWLCLSMSVSAVTSCQVCYVNDGLIFSLHLARTHVSCSHTWTCRIHMLHMLTARTSSWLYAFLRNLISKSPFANSSKEIVPDPSWKPSESLTIFKISIFDGSWLGNARMHDNHRDL